MNPRSTDCEADALTTTPSRRSESIDIFFVEEGIIVFTFPLKIVDSKVFWGDVLSVQILHQKLHQSLKEINLRDDAVV